MSSRAHRVQPQFVSRGAVKNLQPDDEFFQFRRAILQRVFYRETQEPADPFRIRKTVAGKDSFKL